MSFDASYAFDDKPAGSVASDAFGARVYVDSEGGLLTLRFASLDDVERLLDDLLHDVVLIRQQAELPFNGKPQVSDIKLRKAQRGVL